MIRSSNKSAAGKRGIRGMFQTGRPWPTLPGRERSAAGATTTTMNIKKLSTITFAMLLFPAAALAQTTGSSGEGSSWGNLFWGIFPIVILVLIFIPLIRRMQKPIMKRTQQHMERQVQHMERVEQSLERIIKAVERKDYNAEQSCCTGRRARLCLRIERYPRGAREHGR
jgi:hypothetical protein